MFEISWKTMTLNVGIYLLVWNKIYFQCKKCYQSFIKNRIVADTNCPARLCCIGFWSSSLMSGGGGDNCGYCIVHNTHMEVKVGFKEVTLEATSV